LNAQLGYLASAVRTSTDAHRLVLGSDVDPAVAIRFIPSGAVIAQELDRSLDELAFSTDSLANEIEPAILTFSTASSSAVATCNSICVGPAPVRFTPCPYANDSDETRYAQRLEALDRSLAGTYRAAWQALYTNSHDPGRPALWQMRQVMDHFFGLLAPDARVRQSAAWTPKAGDKRDAVHRSERWRFAADHWLKDSNARRLFVESAKEVDQAYDQLNQAHKRGALDRTRAEETFRAADAVALDR
jgi:hypothetical protein